MAHRTDCEARMELLRELQLVKLFKNFLQLNKLSQKLIVEDFREKKIRTSEYPP
jgi:hypothetical protein